MRITTAVLATLVLAACGKNTDSPVGPKNPGGTGQAPLATGSIPATGGFITVNKPGDPLNGFTVSLPSGAFSGSLNVTITELSNASWPRAKGIVPISPIVHIASNQGGYAALPITIKLPAKVPANTFPVLVMYDAATHALEPLTTVAYDSVHIVALTTHLNTANIQQRQASLSGLGAHMRGAFPAGASSASGDFFVGGYALPLTVVNQDWDTGFRPGTNDWEFSVPAVAQVDTSINPLAGAALTEAWYFNSGISSTPLNRRFASVKNAPLSDSLGIVWTSQFSETSPLAIETAKASIAAYAKVQRDSVYLSDTNPQVIYARLDQLMIRANFALSVMTGAKPLPVLVIGPLIRNGDTATRGEPGYTTLVAYRASGSQISVADPGAAGNASRVLNYPSGKPMTPYNPGQYVPGITVLNLVPASLGLLVPPGVLASQYQQVLNGTIRNAALWPTVSYKSYFGQFYDTVYVVDTLRLWTECPQCQYGVANTVAPSGAKQEFVIQGYNIVVGDSVAYDSGQAGATSILLGPGGGGADSVAGYGRSWALRLSHRKPQASNWTGLPTTRSRGWPFMPRFPRAGPPSPEPRSLTHSQ